MLQVFLSSELPAPVVTISGVNTGTVGDQLLLVCTVRIEEHLTPSAQLTVQWTGDSVGDSGVTQSETVTSGITSTRNLTFSSLNTSHGATYSCEADITISSINVVKSGSDSRDIMVQSEAVHQRFDYHGYFSSHSLSVPRPVVAVSAAVRELVSGSSLSLSCSIQPLSVDTSTTITSNWTSPGGRHDRVNNDGDTSPELVISSVETVDSGVYTCSVIVTDSTGSQYVLDSPLTDSTISITVSK